VSQFSVKRDYLECQGYRISIGIGRTFHADTIDQVKLALEHYFSKPWHGETLGDCPLCPKKDPAPYAIQCEMCGVPDPDPKSNILPEGWTKIPIDPERPQKGYRYRCEEHPIGIPGFKEYMEESK
jgi:hypothetical protein